MRLSVYMIHFMLLVGSFLVLSCSRGRFVQAGTGNDTSQMIHSKQNDRDQEKTKEQLEIAEKNDVGEQESGTQNNAGGFKDASAIEITSEEKDLSRIDIMGPAGAVSIDADFVKSQDSVPVTGSNLTDYQVNVWQVSSRKPEGVAKGDPLDASLIGTMAVANDGSFESKMKLNSKDAVILEISLQNTEANLRLLSRDAVHDPKTVMWEPDSPGPVNPIYKESLEDPSHPINGGGNTTGCEGVEVGGYCWYLGEFNQSCVEVCSGHGGYHSATEDYAGNNGTDSQCSSVLAALGAPGAFRGTARGFQTGCVYSSDGGGQYRVVGTSFPDAQVSHHRRACACKN